MHGMTVRNDRLKWSFAEMLKWSFAETLIGCYLWGLSLRLHVLTVWRWSLIGMPMIDVFFSKKTWWNECVWGPINGLRWRKEMIKWMWCQECCTRPWNGQMHWRNCLWSGLHPMLRLLNARWRLSDSPKLHLMPMSSDALTVVSMSGCCTRPWNSQMHWRFSDFFEGLRLNGCLLTQARRLMLAEIAGWLAGCKASCWLMTQVGRQMLASTDCERFFSLTGGFFFAFPDVFRAVNVVSRWLGYPSCKARWIWLVCDDTSIFDRSSDFPN